MTEPSNPNPDRELPPNAGADASPPVRPENRFEERDVRFRWVLLITVVGGLVGAGIFFLVRGFYWMALESGAETRATTFVPPEKPTSELPPEPRLELLDRLAKTPAANVSKWERGEEKSLETYGTTDEKGFVRIPLERAMQLLADHLPARKATDRPNFKDRGLVDAGESNSGRMFRGAAP